MRFRVIGAGRAGRSFVAALSDTGWISVGLLGRGDDVTGAAEATDVLLIAVPDDAIEAVARRVDPGQAAIVHLSGSKSLAALAPHRRRASVHPLVSLPDPDTGRQRLSSGVTFAVAGDPVASRIVSALGGRAIEVDEARRPLYHAAASVAANHLVAICAQVERLAEAADVPPAAYWELMSLTLQNVMAVGAEAALTGPASRGDQATIAAHLAAMDPDERSLYLALADAAASIAGQPLPSEQPGSPAEP